jgi:serine/threonine protein kinase
MGRLYVAEPAEESPPQILALKRILPHLADSAHFRELFLKEALVAGRLKHANIVATHEFGEIEGSYFVSMEYLAGEDLATVWERSRTVERMPLPIAMAIVEQAATGLHYAHEARDAQNRPLGLVHRDVNPANLFVTYDGVVKLLDFGIVKNASAGQRTAPGIFKGTYGYCAPEQVVGGNVDRQTDVFCLGIVFWELLTGRRLFDDGNQVTTIDAVRSRKIDAPSKLRPEVPPEIDAIVLRALDRERRGRFVSAHQLAGELRGLARQLPMPPSKEIGAWLQQLCGTERVACKRAIAQGRQVEEALERLAALDTAGPRHAPSTGSHPRSPALVEPRALWITQLPARTSSSASRPLPSSGSSAALAAVAPARRRLVIGAVIGAVAAGAIAFTVLRSPASRPPAMEVAATAAVAIRSRPAGAAIIVDGQPSGLATPATLSGLRLGRTVELRLDKPGYTPASRRLVIAAGATAYDFELAEATGTLRLENLPAGATLFVDDQSLEGRGPFAVAIGKRRLRVETSNDVLFTAELEIQRGEQTVRLAPSRKAP